ncbi:uncharacterized protein I206_107848 [Kwoniella pini CBS 10737]|uniref:Zn(2)-C6 fungal-type domain-containing protein n=1 Tax=Kwoniella pini CBS 10737 TaxID=1296096 RepID=A0AAJ8MS46_9TREE
MTGSQSAPSSTGPTRKPTRHQPIVSCMECRRMKWKCDRKFPCANCRKRGIESMCPNGQMRPVRGSQYLQVEKEIEILKMRNMQLEKILKEAQRQGFEIHPTTDDLTVPADNQVPIDRSTPEKTNPNWQEIDVVSGSRGPSSDGDIEDGQLIVGEEPGSSSFFGNAGAHYHLHLDGNSSQRISPSVRTDLPTGWLDTFPLPAAAPPTVDKLSQLLPQKADATKWAVIYFEDAAVLNYSVDPEYFWRHIFQRAYPPDIPSPVSKAALNSHELGLMYLILATGAAMDLSLPPYNEFAERFFTLGRIALAIDPTDSILFVQSIHIMSRYLSNSFRGPKATLGFWSCLGMAVRSAQSMGLHRDGKRWKLPPEEIELRRRVFWEIYTEDVLQCMTQARPRLISFATIDCALPQYIYNEKDEDDRLLFHHYKYRLCKILSKVNDVQVNVDPMPYKQILAIHDSLRNFEDELPPLLRTDNNHNEVHRSVVWQRLTLRLLNMEGYLFLHRAHFARALKDHPVEPMMSAYRFSYVAELEASRVILLILQEALSSNQQIACRFLIFFFHAFTAVVNFTAVVVRSPQSSLAKAAFAQVEHGVNLFETIEEGFRARDDLPRLRILLEQARSSISQTHHGLHKASDIDVSSFGFGPRLVRVQKPSTARQEQHQQIPDLFEHNLGFPTTLADASRLTRRSELPEYLYTSDSAPSPLDLVEHEQALFSDWLSAEWTLPLVPERQETESGPVLPVMQNNEDQDIYDFLINIGLDPNMEHKEGHSDRS